ncbi:MAG: sulfite reductase subunit alpha [Verrucomicrobia bacterium]|nr:sulfite reductase subunit alpha [Verrucomicrobiota bacterium]
MKQLVPVLPDTAPFTPEQRAYLNGFLAGLFSPPPGPAVSNLPPQITESKPLTPLTILFGSQTGNAEGLAKRAAKEASRRGFAATVCELAQYPREKVTSEERLLIITSTYGDGEPPDNAKALWEFLARDDAPRLPQLKFSVLALGDSNYPKFCECGKKFDRRLEELGAQRVAARVDCDVGFEAAFAEWLGDVLAALAQRGEDTAPYPAEAGRAGCPQPAAGVTTARIERRAGDSAPYHNGYSRQNPFPARLVTNRPLNAAGSAKDTRHFELALDESGLSYEAGDALGVMPSNCPALVEELIRALACTGDEAVPAPDSREVSLREALAAHYEITRIPQPLLQAVAERSGDALLNRLAAPGVNGELTEFLWGREIIDLLLAHPHVKFTPQEFLTLLKKLQPRLYSISSSPKAHPGHVHLTVGVLRYESLGRARKGVCSTFLADRVGAETLAPVFVQPNKSFRPPTDGDRPMIMVGPGTGIAPFRAFLQERQAIGARGQNWLFFGDQRGATDFLYRDELETFLRDDTLKRLDVAFSRDQPEKIYVQHRMLEQAGELFTWLEEGAHFYVCGDAKRMAKDVDAALHRVIQTAGGHTAGQAADYVRRLQAGKRYQRDVY